MHTGAAASGERRRMAAPLLSLLLLPKVTSALTSIVVILMKGDDNYQCPRPRGGHNIRDPYLHPHLHLHAPTRRIHVEFKGASCAYCEAVAMAFTVWELHERALEREEREAFHVNYSLFTSVSFVTLCFLI